MANHQKFIKYLLSFVIAFSPVLLINNANASIGGWTMGNPVAQGASAIVSATKNIMLNGKNVVKTSSAIITPTAVDVAKLLGKGLGGVALSVAVEQLLGAVDWILDPANNQIVYTEKEDPNLPDLQYVYSYNINNPNAGRYATAEQACNKKELLFFYPHFSYFIDRGILFKNGNCIIDPDNLSFTTTAERVLNPAYNPSETDDKPKTIPLPTVANKVISNAESGNTDAQAVTTAAASDALTNDTATQNDVAKQLDSNSKTATKETATGKAETKADEQTSSSSPTVPKPATTTDISLDFPVFCGWAPTVCEAMKTVLDIPNIVSDYSQSIKDYFKEETATDTEIDIPLPNQENIDTDINFSSSCPANFTLANFSYHGTSQNWEVDFSKFCDVFGTYVKPVVIAMGAFSAALIVGGVRTNE